ncbi:DUF5994 family protein [Streptomyces sp. NBC_01803]|uniref:DUF5994 family protein n=1 Tax=Streptomyces sp. NBC_01803 TaxID=2975946 RepID=UPI002DD8938C|nr:DUF5994 family protein [Streptomyces sp. NBC_01803]WSA46358.1 DUF5994 family protein [Streptomyces sp. NBC_01803]
MTVISDPTTAQHPDTRIIRLSLAPGGSGPGPLDGAWWPYSRDLMLELPLLTAEFDSRWGRVTRAAVNPAHWPIIPRKILVPGRVVHVGWFSAEQDPHALLLLSGRVKRWDLLVIPPGTPAATAARLMAAASDPGSTLTAGALMAQARTAVAAAGDSARVVDWEAGGGRGLAVPAAPPPGPGPA